MKRVSSLSSTSPSTGAIWEGTRQTLQETAATGPVELASWPQTAVESPQSLIWPEYVNSTLPIGLFINSK